MLVVKIELWPRGREAGAFEIGRMYVANDGAGTHLTGNYRVAVCRKNRTEVPREIYSAEQLTAFLKETGKTLPKASRSAQVKNYPRLACNVWRLVARALHAAFPEEAKRAKRDEKTLLSEDVMRGLRLLADHLENDGHNWTEGTDMEDVEAALAWLKEANS